jgi:tRNA U34 5-methylaminomethyl-2-thiouridine-forming methyltransferase MnmC
MTNTEGALVTYCAKGYVKRNLKAAGFRVETLPGPAKKREMTRGIKI